MKLDSLRKRPIVLVFGKLCSGKGTYCTDYAKQGYIYVSTSDIVKQVSGAKTRGALQHTKDKDVEIAKEIIKIIERNPKVIIDGIRQPSVVDAILSKFDRSSIEMIWLDVPDDVRKDRFTKRGAVKDDQSFEDADKGDVKLGLHDLEKKYKPESTVVTNG